MAQDHIYLEYDDSYSNSHKYWEAILDGKKFVVNFGRQHTTGQNRIKTLPSDSAAHKEYNAKVREKLAKGYAEKKGVHTPACCCAACSGNAPSPVQAAAPRKAPKGTPVDLPVGRARITADKARTIEALLADDEDEDENPAPAAPLAPAKNPAPTVKPMLAEETDHMQILAYSRDDDWWVEQKVDGHRVLLTVENGRAKATGRNGQPSQHNPRFMQPHYADITRLDGIVLDGELVGDVMWLFDLPWEDGQVEYRKTPYEERRERLEKVFADWAPESSAYRLLPVARTEEEKTKLSLECLQKGGEGVMLKRRNGLYVPSRVRHVLKAKFVKTVDCVITGVGMDGHDNYELSLYHPDGSLKVIGRCSAIGKESCQIGDVAEIKYLYIGADNRLYQPRFMHKRTDKDAPECTVDQIANAKVNKSVFA